MRLGLCKDCGKVFDEEDLTDGYCAGCPASDPIELQEEPPAVDWDRVTGDCV
jgi:hypothetical protein